MTSPLGLKRGTIRLEPHNPEWRKLFEVEESALKEALGDKFIAAEHVGSTAIPDIKAKPLLDLMLSIPNLNDWKWIEEKLAKLEYEFRRDLRQEQGCILFVKGSEDNRTHYLKVTESDSDFWLEHIIFRDYLIANQQYREEYQDLKEEILAAHNDSADRGSYTEAKEKFIQKILELAGSADE